MIKNKFEEIEKKLKNCNYNKFNFQSDENLSEDLYYKNMDLFPDISFENKNKTMEINFFFDQHTIDVNMLDKRREFKNNNQVFECQKVYFFKSFSIADFYKLFIEYNFDIQQMILTSDN